MKKIFKGVLVLLALTLTLICATAGSAFAASEDAKWITAWGTAPTEIGIEGYDNISAMVSKVTVRSVITPTADGSAMRIRFSNAYGKEPLNLTRITVAKSAGGANIDLSGMKSVTFNQGQPFVKIPAGAEVLSDPITFDVKAGEPVAISIFVEDFAEVKTMGLSGADTYIATSLEGDGDFTDQASMDLGSILDDEEIMKYLSFFIGDNSDIKLSYSFINVVPCLASVEVLADENAYSVVVVGDSTVANEFPEYLGEVINEKGYKNVGVVGKGIMGNRLLGDGLGYGGLLYGDSLLDRFNRDVISQSGVKYAVIKIGANDIIHPVCNDIKEQYPGIKQPTSDELIEGYKKLFKMCHDAGIKVVVMSITPWKGATRDYFGTEPKYVRSTAEFEADWKIAEDVNAWLAKTKLHDGFVNVNEYSANPKDTSAFMPDYTIDGIHPSDLMQSIWAEKFPLSLVGVGRTVGGVRLNATKKTLYVGDKFTLTADVYPSKAKNKTVEWSSDNTKVLKVSSKGVVTCVGKGTATVTCKTEDGGYKATCKFTVRVRTAGVSLNKTKASVYTTRSTQLKATVTPKDAYNKDVTWSSSNTKVAKVDKNGKVTGVGAGKAVITVKTKSGSHTAKCTVTVKPKVQVIEISLNRTKGSIAKGKTYQLKATVTPSNATFPEVEWASSNKKVATVSSTGKIKAVGAGKAVIVCRSVDNPRVLATCNVTVVVSAKGVKLNSSKASVYETMSVGLKATVSPSDATYKNVTWSSSNSKVAKVDKNGKVTGVKPGKTVITCKTADGKYTAKCTVSVKKLTKVKSVSLNKTSGAMYVGNSYQLKATVKPSDASVKTVKWSSSDTKVAKVDKNGKVTGVGTGKAVITCKTKQGGKTVKCTVTVVPVKVKSITLNKTSGTIAYGKTYQLKATVTPAKASADGLVWTSSNPKAVSVSSKGLVKALKANSSAVITCKSSDGKVSATCKVKVAPIAVKGIQLNKSSASIAVGKSTTLIAVVTPTGASDKSVTWASSNPDVAEVTQKGVVTGKSGGNATIYCKTKDGGFVAACKVKVTGSKVQVLGVMLDRGTHTATVGSSFTLKATVIPDNAADKRVKWSTNDASVAVVDANGKVTCKGKGVCYISVATVDGNWVEACKVTVN